MTRVTLKVSRDEAQLIINTLAQLPFNQVAMLVPELVRQANVSLVEEHEPKHGEMVAQETQPQAQAQTQETPAAPRAAGSRG